MDMDILFLNLTISSDYDSAAFIGVVAGTTILRNVYIEGRISGVGAAGLVFNTGFSGNSNLTIDRCCFNGTITDNSFSGAANGFILLSGKNGQTYIKDSCFIGVAYGKNLVPEPDDFFYSYEGPPNIKITTTYFLDTSSNVKQYWSGTFSSKNWTWYANVNNGYPVLCRPLLIKGNTSAPSIESKLIELGFVLQTNYSL